MFRKDDIDDDDAGITSVLKSNRTLGASKTTTTSGRFSRDTIEDGLVCHEEEEEEEEDDDDEDDDGSFNSIRVKTNILAMCHNDREISAIL
jgi:hypothetical protein